PHPSQRNGQRCYAPLPFRHQDGTHTVSELRVLGGRSRVRTWVGLADGFTDRFPYASEWLVTWQNSLGDQVNPQACPPYVPAPGRSASCHHGRARTVIRVAEPTDHQSLRASRHADALLG